ncbi:MAG: NAD-dependent epimerase/dehydratase family protein [Woeseiaceae bacterium]
MRWLITGGCGFIGVNLIHSLLEDAENQIVVLDNLSVGTRQDLRGVCDFEGASSPVDLIEGDIMDADTVVAAMDGVDVVVHLAANTGVGPSVEDPRQDCTTNVIGTLNVLEAARACDTQRVIFASSGAPIGECEPPIHEELPAHPVSPYGASKLAGEGYCSAYFRSFGIDTVALRFGNVYGERSKHKSSAVAKFIGLALAGESLDIYGDGGQTRDFIYVGDLVAAILKSASTADIGGEIFQIATHQETSVNELVDTLKVVLEEKRPGLNVVTTNSEPRVGDVRRNFSDTSKAGKQLGWQAESKLEDGLAKTVDWFLREAR